MNFLFLGREKLISKVCIYCQNILRPIQQTVLFSKFPVSLYESAYQSHLQPGDVVDLIRKSYEAFSFKQPELPKSNEKIEEFNVATFDEQSFPAAAKQLKQGLPIFICLEEISDLVNRCISELRAFLWNDTRAKFFISIKDSSEPVIVGDTDHPYGNLTQINFCDFPTLNSPLVLADKNILLRIRYLQSCFSKIYLKLLFHLQEEFSDEFSFLRLMLLNYTPFLEFLKYKSRNQSLSDGCPQDYMFYPHIDTQQPLTFDGSTDNLIVNLNDKWFTLPPLPRNQILVMPGLALRCLLNSPQEYRPLIHGVTFPTDPSVKRQTFTFYVRRAFTSELRANMLLI